MNATERARKLAALIKLFQGNDKPARALYPPIIWDTNKDSDETMAALKAIQRFGFYNLLKTSSVERQE